MKFEYLYCAFRLKGRGYTGEVVDLHINGRPDHSFQRIPDMLNALGQEGWELKTYGDKGEHGTYENMVFQRAMA